MRRPAHATAVSGRHDRRRAVEASLAPFVRRSTIRQVSPPEGRLGSGDYPIRRLGFTLSSLGPVFASFGRYLATRPDLLPRRDCRELAAVPDAGEAADPTEVEALVYRQLGAPPARRFVQFDWTAHDVTLWVERHEAWVAAGVPVTVTIVRPDAAECLARDLPLLPLLQPCFAVSDEAFAAAIDDFARTLRGRLDQAAQAMSLVALSNDAAAVGGYAAPVCYRDHCAPGILTTERAGGPTLASLMTSGGEDASFDRAALARRLASAWLRQARTGRAVPFDFDARDIVVTEDRLLLAAAAFEPHGGAERTRFARYLNAVAADDPDAAAAWVVDAAAGSESSGALEEELKRRLRQAVPFRDGEWSGDDRLAEDLLVQWRVAREAGWTLPVHHLHVYRGLYAVARLAEALAPADDVLQAALDAERLDFGLSEAAQLVDPRTLPARLDSALQEMVGLPQKLDEVLTLAAEGRLRVKLQVPERAGVRQTRHQTIRLVAILVVLTALASLLRHVTPAFGPAIERVGVVMLLVIGGWLMVAAARM